MISKKEIENEIEGLLSMENMITSYEEIAAGRIKQSRESVLRSRTFSDDINLIFSEVISSYRNQVAALLKAKKVKSVKDFSFMKKNGKTLYLLISSNTGLYGSITKRTFDLFVEKSKGEHADRAIIGKLGQTMWQRQKANGQSYYFDFPDQSVDKNLLKKILEFIVSYEKVLVFYGKFQNMVSQEATFSDVSGTSIANEEAASKIKYFFEPGLDKILEFFEKQIFASVFEQVMRESQLAKMSSRLTTLESASENIKKELAVFTVERNKSMHRINNKKQLQTFSSRFLWGGKS